MTRKKVRHYPPDAIPDGLYTERDLRAYPPRGRKPAPGAQPVGQTRHSGAKYPTLLYDLADTVQLSEAERARPVRCASCGKFPPKPASSLCHLCDNP